MIPVLPSNPMTIAPRQWFTNTEQGIRERLTHLRRLDTLYRRTDVGREAEKKELEAKLRSFIMRSEESDKRPG